MQKKLKEGTFPWYKSEIKKVLNDDMNIYQNQLDAYQLLYWLNQDVGFDNKEVLDFAMKSSKYAHWFSDTNRKCVGDNFDRLYWQFLLMEGQFYQVDSGLLYLEKNRVPKERFYEPRREVFLKHGITQGFQDLMDDKIDLLSVSMPPGVGKSSMEIFFLALAGGWFPNDFNLSSAHSSILTRSLYDGVSAIIDDSIEYAWHELFPNVKTQGKNAKETTINLERAGRFKTWTFRSIDGSLTGATRCNRFLTSDDLVSGIEEALNKSRLETLWTKVVNDLRSRRLDGCKEILFATRWSNHDPIGKIQKKYEGNPRARFIAVPALDENGESNFMFTVNGFSKEYFLDQKEFMDEISFNCLYQQKPVEREGLLFPADSLRRFYLGEEQVPAEQTVYNVIPDRMPDAIWGVCDTKDKGSDYESLPVAYQYGDYFYIVDAVFDDTTDYELLDQKTADIIIKHNPHKVRFETNSAGGRVAYDVGKLIEGKCMTEIEPRPTSQNKETKILANSRWIKKYCLFLEPSLYTPNSDYGKFMGNLVSYTTKAKVPHDDAPDSMAMFSEMVREMFGDENRGMAIVVKSPY